MRTLANKYQAAQLAKTVAAEDLRKGDFIAVLEAVHEYPSFLWFCEPHVLAPEELVQLRWRSPDDGRPLKVRAICLPYVLVKAPGGRHATLDVRQCQLVRLGQEYAEAAWKALRKQWKKDQK